MACAANKPDSVHLPCGGLRSFIYAINPELHRLLAETNRTGRPFCSLFDLAPRRVCPAGRLSPWPRWSLAPPFHPCRPKAAVSSLWHFPSATVAVTLPVLTTGSSALRSPDFPHPFGRDRSHTHVTEIKDRGKGCARTSCRPPVPGCAAPSGQR